MTVRMPNPFDFGLPLPTSAAEVPSDVADQTAVPLGDAPGTAVDHPRRFVPDMNRLYLDMVSMPEVLESKPLFLRKPYRPINDPIVERKAARNFVQALIDLGRRD